MLKLWVLGGCLTLVFCNDSVYSPVFPPQVYTIEIKGMRFVPADIQVKKGDTIIWVNKDIVAHNVTDEKSKAWASPIIPVGQSWSMMAEHSSNYFCSLHPVMKGRIQVP